MIEYSIQSPSGLMWLATNRKGMPAGTLASSGYYEVQIQGKKKQAHRVVWELHNGPVPPGKCIDHINRVRTDNRIENLRLASVSDNNCNSTRPTRELPRGIYHNGKAYRAEFWKSGKRYRKISGSLNVCLSWLEEQRALVQGEFLPT